MLIKITEVDKSLTLDVKMSGAVAIVNMEDAEIADKLLVEDTNITPLGARTITDANGNVIHCIGIVKDPLYKNSIMVLYSKEDKLLFAVPNVLHFLKLFSSTTVQVSGVGLGTKLEKRNDNVSSYSLTHVHSNVGKIDLDEAKLDTITISTASFNIPGVVNDNNLGKAIYLKHGSGDTINFENSCLSVAIKLVIPEDVLVDKTLISGVVFPYNVKNNRYEIFDIEKDKLADFSKWCFIM